MQQDADGDVADQFLSELPAPPSPAHETKRPHTGRERPLPPLQVGSLTTPNLMSPRSRVDEMGRSL